MLNKLILITAILAALVTGNSIGATLMTHERVVVQRVPVFIPVKQTKHYREQRDLLVAAIPASLLKPIRNMK